MFDLESFIAYADNNQVITTRDTLVEGMSSMKHKLHADKPVDKPNLCCQRVVYFRVRPQMCIG